MEAPPAKTGPRPLLGLTARPGALPEMPPPPKDPTARREWLKARLDEVFSAPALAKSKVAMIAVESDTGRTVYARGEKTPLNVASNVKIVTSAAALSLLGPEYRWRTTLSFVGPPGGPPLPAGGEIEGDFFLRGAGDPDLSTEDLATMVGDLAALGLHKVRGALVVDDTLFERGYVPPAYDQKNDSTASRAPASAASLNGNVVAVTIIRARRPAPPRGSSSIPPHPTSRSRDASSPPRRDRRPPTSTRKRRRITRASTSAGGSRWAPIRARSTVGSFTRRCSWGTP